MPFRSPAGAAVLSVIAALLASGCNSAGTGSFNPLDPYEPAPASTDTPPSTWETPPASGDTPSSTVDPLPGQGCTACGGTFTCNEGGTTFSITLTRSGGGCNLAATTDGMTLNLQASCGDQTGDAGASEVTYSVGANGTLTACESSACLACTPGGSGASSADAGGGSMVTINTGGGCEALSNCCSRLSNEDQSACQAVVQEGADSVCQTALEGFQEQQLCD